MLSSMDIGNAVMSPVRESPCPTLLFCRRMIELAFHDAKECDLGVPTEQAVQAYLWLTDNSQPFIPASFLWCCHFLGDNPRIILEEGLLNPCRRGKHLGMRLGGLSEIHAAWDLAAKEAEDVEVEQPCPVQVQQVACAMAGC
jgi:hypothetical protein